MSYPPAPSVPSFISVTPNFVSIAFSTTLQLVPVLTDTNGNTVSATKPFSYSSSNDALLSVDSDGLCSAVTPTDTNLLNEGGIVEITVSYPFANRTTGETISAVSTIKVQSNAARTQAILRTDDTQYARPAVSKWVEYQVASATAPEPTYPPGWVISN
jgi:hypothetical protein